MKVGVIILILLLSTVLVNAELSVSCTRNSDCTLALGDAYSCIEAFCVKADAEESVYVVLEAEQQSLNWNLLVLETKEGICSQEEGCLFFAPGKERSSFWLFRFFRFVFYL